MDKKYLVSWVTVSASYTSAGEHHRYYTEIKTLKQICEWVKLHSDTAITSLIELPEDDSHSNPWGR